MSCGDNKVRELPTIRAEDETSHHLTETVNDCQCRVTPHAVCTLLIQPQCDSCTTALSNLLFPMTRTQSSTHVVSERPITCHASFAYGKLACNPNSLTVMDSTAVVLFNVELKSFSPSRIVRSVSKDRSRGKNCILPP